MSTIKLTVTTTIAIEAKVQCYKQYTAEPDKATYVESGTINAIKVGAVETR